MLDKAARQEDILDLGMRFRLAKKLVDAVHMMHCVGWVHKYEIPEVMTLPLLLTSSVRNIRPGSVLFFPKDPYKKHSSDSLIHNELGYDKPTFVGFGDARPDKIPVVVKYAIPRLDKKAGAEPMTHAYGPITETRTIGNCYHHPAKRKDPKLPYSRSFDIYSLGCVLLEIARWKPLKDVADLDVPPDDLASALKFAAKSLKGCAKSSPNSPERDFHRGFTNGGYI